jgi:hypothetical protein
MLHSRYMTAAIRPRVHTCARKPYASAPRSNSAGKRASSSVDNRRGRRGVAVPEAIQSALARTRHPLAGRPFADAQGCGDPPLGPALPDEVPGLKSSGFFPIVGRAVQA